MRRIIPLAGVQRDSTVAANNHMADHSKKRESTKWWRLPEMNESASSQTYFTRKRLFTSLSRASDSGLNLPVRSISTLKVTGTLLALHDRT